MNPVWVAFISGLVFGFPLAVLVIALFTRFRRVRSEMVRTAPWHGGR